MCSAWNNLHILQCFAGLKQNANAQLVAEQHHRFLSQQELTIDVRTFKDVSHLVAFVKVKESMTP